MPLEKAGGVIETEHISKWGPLIGTETGTRVTRIFAQSDAVQAKPALEEATAPIVWDPHPRARAFGCLAAPAPV